MSVYYFELEKEGDDGKFRLLANNFWSLNSGNFTFCSLITYVIYNTDMTKIERRQDYSFGNIYIQPSNDPAYTNGYPPTLIINQQKNNIISVILNDGKGGFNGGGGGAQYIRINGADPTSKYAMKCTII